jgi:DNA-binding response OmpR family regulator
MPRIKSSVLIIENDPPTLELYRRELSREYKVFACLDEEKAIHLAADTKDLCAVVLEPEISGGDGWALLSILIRVFGERRVPIILCSTQDEQRRGLKEGAAAFLVKPVLPVDLHNTLRKIVG